MHFSSRSGPRHHDRAPRYQVISSCCCDCIRTNSHLFGHGYDSYDTGSETDNKMMRMQFDRDPRWLHPSACHNIDMGERRRFFEHLSCAHDFSEGEYLEHCRYCTEKQQRPQSRFPPRHNWRWHKPQKRRRKCPSSCGFRRPQRHPHPHTRNLHQGQHQHHKFRHQAEPESHPTQEQEYRSGRNAEQERFYQNINQGEAGAHFHRRHRQYAYSDVEYPNRLRTTIDQTSIHEPTAPARRPIYSFDYKDYRPPYEAVSLWKRPNSPARKGDVEDETPSNDSQDGVPELGREKADYKWSLAKHQESREYLNTIQTVRKTRTDWETRISTDPKFRNAIMGQRIETEVPVHKEAHALKTGVVNGGQNHVRTSDVANSTRTEVRARHSHSSPMLQRHAHTDTVAAAANGDRKPKSHPRRHSGKFPYPEYEHLNLSSMKLPDRWSKSKSNSGEIKAEKKHENNSDDKQITKKYFEQWKARAARRKSRKYPSLEKKESRMQDGLLILSHSKSQQEITTTTHGFRRSVKDADAGTAASTKSAPPQSRPTRWFGFLDSVNPWAPMSTESGNPPPPVAEPQPEHTPVLYGAAPASAAVARVDFAIEIDAKLPAERATSVTNETEEALRRLSVDYNNIVAAGTRTESLDIQDSRLAFNVFLENIAKSKGRRSTGAGNHSHQTAGNGKQRHSEQRTVIGHRICQFCQQLITEPVEPHKVLQVQGRNMFWHRECFRCAECETLLDSQHHYFWKGSVYCVQHYAIIAQVPQCAACHEHIFDRTITLAMGHTWHKHHFQCLNCKRPLIDTKFIKIGSSSAICFECQQKLYSKKCMFCGQRILPTDIYVRSGNCFWHSNDSCINCQTCHRNVSSDSRIFVRHGKTFCNRYCAQMNVSPAIALNHENPEVPAA